jgi:hypothetical protein
LSDITPEMVEAAKSRDRRIGLIAEAFAVEAEVRDSPTIRYLLRQITTDSDRAMEELADISPLDHTIVAKLLVKIQSYVYIRRSLEDLKRRATVAAHEVHLEDAAAAGFDERDD